jgi:ribokinase
MVVKLGTDAFGDLAQANMINEGIRPDYIFRTEEAHTGAALIMLDAAGENMIVVAAGANTLLSPDDVDKARDAVTEADVVLVQLEIPMETVEHAIRLAHEAGVTALLNPAPGREIHPDLLAMCDVVTPNETETQIITGLTVRDASDAEAAAKRLLQQGVGAAVVTLGASGALVVTAAGVEHMPGRRVEVVDTTGAGDAFSGALAVGLAEGMQLREGVDFANAAAALQVTKIGTAPAMPYRECVDAFLAS